GVAHPQVGHQAVVQVQVRAADRGELHLHDRVVRVLDLRTVLLLDTDLVRPAVGHGAHLAPSLRPGPTLAGPGGCVKALAGSTAPGYSCGVARKGRGRERRRLAAMKVLRWRRGPRAVRPVRTRCGCCWCCGRTLVARMSVTMEVRASMAVSV